jgi:xeroderma pigmentosum group C-complementing protein
VLRALQGAPEAGGYLTAADDVVQAFHLPKYQHVVAAYSSDSPSSRSGQDKNTYVIQNKIETSTGHHIPQEQDDDVEMEVEIPQLQPRSENGVPLTMRELADTVRRQRSINGSIDESDLPASSPSTNHGLTVDNTKSGNAAKSTKKSARPTKTVSKPRDSARKRPRDESDHPVLNTPTRVLRPRASKSATQIQEEREREHAYRQAIAE